LRVEARQTGPEVILVFATSTARGRFAIRHGSAPVDTLCLSETKSKLSVGPASPNIRGDPPTYLRSPTSQKSPLGYPRYAAARGRLRYQCECQALWHPFSLPPWHHDGSSARPPLRAQSEDAAAHWPDERNPAGLESQVTREFHNICVYIYVCIYIYKYTPMYIIVSRGQYFE
jgi:hypothetical protein